MVQLSLAASALSPDAADLETQALLMGERAASQAGAGVTRRMKSLRSGPNGS